ncbi:MAG TPA: hypothetical protein VGC37_11945 [Friedmanniella sp.]
MKITSPPGAPVLCWITWESRDLMADVVFVLVTVIAFAVLAAVVRGGHRL